MKNRQPTTDNLPREGKWTSSLLVVGSWLLGVPASAQEPFSIFEPEPGSLDFAGLANTFGTLVNAVIPFLIGVAIVAVIWGIFQYITAAGDAEKIADGRKAALYGILALFIMVSFWGLVMLIKRSLFGE